MHILHVIEGIDTRLGGLSYLLANITAMEQQVGHTNEVLSIECPEQYINRELTSKFHLFPPSFPSRFINSSQAIDWLKTHICSYDLLIIHSTWNILSQRASYVARAKGVPYVFWPHNSLDPFDLQKKRILKSLLGPIFIRKHLDGALALCSASERESDRLCTYGSNTPRHVLPYPVSYFKQGGDRKRFRDTYLIREEAFTFLFLSRVDYKKGLDLALKAFAKLNLEIPTCQFVVAGPDTKGYSAYITRLITELHLESNVKVIGAVSGESKSDAFLGADCFVLTSLNESFGMAVVEALQSSLPVLISDNVYIFDDIDRLQGGWICSTDVQSIYTKMKEIVQNKMEYNRIKGQALQAGLYFSDLSRLKQVYSTFYSSLH